MQMEVRVNLDRAEEQSVELRTKKNLRRLIVSSLACANLLLATVYFHKVFYGSIPLLDDAFI